jgi:predicted ester cyclase
MFSRKERAEAKAVKQVLSEKIKPRPTFEQRQENKQKLEGRRKESEERDAIVAKRLAEVHAGSGSGDVVQLGSQLLYLDALSGIQLQIQEHVGGEAKIITRWTVRGKHDRDFLGMEPTGREVSFGGMTESLLLGDVVNQEFHYWDVVELLRQIQAP